MEKPAGQRAGNILIAESDARDRYLIGRAFGKCGSLCAIHEVQDGEEAVKYLSGDPPYDDRTVYPLPDLLLLDLRMPKRDGFGVLKWLQTRRDLDWIAVVMLSGSHRGDDVQHALDLGADEFYFKPHEFDEMIAIAGKLVARWLP